MLFGSHKFKTAKEDNRNVLVRFFCAFLAFAVVFGSISVVVFLKHNDVSLRDIFGKEKTTEVHPNDQTQEQTDVIPTDISGKANFLVYCTDSDLTEIYFIHIIEADFDEQVIKVLPLKPDNANYLNKIKQGGGKELSSYVQQTESIEINKYVGSNAETFALSIRRMGGFEYTVKDRVEYRNDDFTLILAKGKQNIIGEKLIRYFRYCKTLGEEGLKQQGNLMCSMLDEYLSVENAEKGTDIFSSLLSKINTNTDISFIEAAQTMPKIKAFCESEKRQKSIVISKEDTTEESK